LAATGTSVTVRLGGLALTVSEPFALDRIGALCRRLRAEAQRLIRRTDVRLEQVPAAVDLLVAMATDRSVSLARPDLGIVEPAQLRRLDGASVYTVAGADLLTSSAILAAERQMVTLAGHHGGRIVPSERVTAALATAAGDGQPLNPG